MRTAIENRVSRRTFENRPIDGKKIQVIIELINQFNALSGLKMEFIEDGSRGFQNLKKSYGLFSNVRSIVLMKGEKEDEHLREKIGYYGEALILDMTDLNLGTCWVGGTFDKEEFKVVDDEELVCVIAVGEVVKASLKEKMVRSAARIKSVKMAERIESDQPLPTWVEAGMNAVCLAPSAKNTQKAKFKFKDNLLTASIIDDYMFDLVDLGIAKKHFEIEAKGSFDFGNGAAFHPNK